MIKNIVFDMGKVLVDYDDMISCNHFAKSEEEALAIHRELFRSPEWIDMDRGTMTEEEAMVRIKKRLNNPEWNEAAQQCMDHWHEYNLHGKLGMAEVVADMKHRGYGIYLLSNASTRLRRYQHTLPGFQYFDGTIVSAEEKLLKPEPEIYHRLFDRYNLKPEECFFIDDLEVNIQGAAACGMRGYCFADGSVEKLKKVLDSLNADRMAAEN